MNSAKTHISNRYYRLATAINAALQFYGLRAIVNETEGKSSTMKPEREFIDRSMRRAKDAATRFLATHLPDEKQDAWEEFLPFWRAAFNKMSSFCSKNGQQATATSYHLARKSSQLLDYVWEARNYEGHDDGVSSYPQSTEIMEILVDENEYILTDENDEVLFDSHPERRLAFKPVPDVSGRRVISPPTADPDTVMTEALAFIRGRVEK